MRIIPPSAYGPKLLLRRCVEASTVSGSVGASGLRISETEPAHAEDLRERKLPDTGLHRRQVEANTLFRSMRIASAARIQSPMVER